MSFRSRVLPSKLYCDMKHCAGRAQYPHSSGTYVGYSLQPAGEACCNQLAVFAGFLVLETLSVLVHLGCVKKYQCALPHSGRESARQLTLLLQKVSQSIDCSISGDINDAHSCVTLAGYFLNLKLDHIWFSGGRDVGLSRSSESIHNNQAFRKSTFARQCLFIFVDASDFTGTFDCQALQWPSRKGGAGQIQMPSGSSCLGCKKNRRWRQKPTARIAW